MLKYFKSKEFWFVIVGGSILLAGLVYVLTFYVFLPNYTQHGESVIVPEVIVEVPALAVTRLPNNDPEDDGT